jgi:hypothetical protein
MAELHMSEEDVARNFVTVLEKVVRQGLEVVVEHDRQPVAVLPLRARRAAAAP